MTVAATVVVEFGHGVDSGALVLVELDETMNLDADGEVKTSFAPGDVPFFLVHHEATVRIGAVRCSAGMVSGGNMVTRRRSQQIQFIKEGDTQDLAYVSALLEPMIFSWYGNSPAIIQTGRVLKAAGQSIPAIAEVSYSMEAVQFRLTPPVLELAADETFPVLIVIHMEAA